MINTCRKFGVEAFRTTDTGVWTKSPDEAEEVRKIGSIGVHLRRGITSHGIGLNITNEVLEYFKLIDACGLGKRMTSMEEMGVDIDEGTWREVERTWCEMLGEELEGDVLRLEGIAELAEIWGLKAGEVWDVIMQNELSEEENL